MPKAIEEGEIRAEIAAGGSITEVAVVIVTLHSVAYVPFFRADWRRGWFAMAKWRSTLLRSYTDPRLLLEFIRTKLEYAGTRILFLTEEDPLARDLLDERPRASVRSRPTQSPSS